MRPTQEESLALVKLCCQTLGEKKAGELRVIDVRDQSSITDYLVIATATSEPHMRALRIELEKALDAAKVRIVGFDAERESGWAVMDAFNVMVHVFTPELRDKFGLEGLWRDGEEVSVDAVLGITPAPKRKSVSKSIKKKKPAPSRKTPAKSKKKRK